MKEVMLRVKSGYLDNLILGLFLICGSLGLFLSFQYPTYQNKPSYQKVNIVTVSEPKEDDVEIVETRILTDDELSKLYSCKEDIRVADPIDLTIEEANLLMKLAQAEMGDSDEIAQLMVMNVVMNRLASEEFPDSIEEIIYADSQFSVVDNGVLAKTEPSLTSHIALGMLEMGNVKTDALYFEASWLEGSWQSENRTFVGEYAGTRFYR